MNEGIYLSYICEYLFDVIFSLLFFFNIDFSRVKYTFCGSELLQVGTWDIPSHLVKGPIRWPFWGISKGSRWRNCFMIFLFLFGFFELLSCCSITSSFCCWITWVTGTSLFSMGNATKDCRCSSAMFLQPGYLAGVYFHNESSWWLVVNSGERWQTNAWELRHLYSSLRCWSFKLNSPAKIALKILYFMNLYYIDIYFAAIFLLQVWVFTLSLTCRSILRTTGTWTVSLHIQIRPRKYRPSPTWGSFPQQVGETSFIQGTFVLVSWPRGTRSTRIWSWNTFKTVPILDVFFF